MRLLCPVRRAPRLLAATLFVVGSAVALCPADVVIIGGLGNFDVHNESGGECNEFDIEIEGPHPEDVTHTYHNGNYGSPTITALRGNTGIRVVYAHPNHATALHAIEHFGVSLSNAHPITAQRFNWVLGGLNPPYPPPPPPPPPPPLAIPEITAETYYVPGLGWMIRETLTNVDSLGRTIWIIRKETGVAREVALEELMVDDPLIQGANQLDLEPEELLFGTPLVFEEDAPPPDEMASEILVYEVYENRRELVGGEWTDVPGALITTVMSAALAQGSTCPEEYLPLITLQPQDTSGLLDGRATFAADGIDPTGGGIVNYQWRHEGVDLEGEDNDTLTVDPVLPSDAGAYVCVISNDCGFTVTQAAYLTVLEPCSFLVQPEGSAVCVGDAAFFTVTVQTPQQAFIWRQRGAEIPPTAPRFTVTNSPDARSSTLTIADVHPSDIGAYDVLLEGDCENIVSNSAALKLSSSGSGDANCDCAIDFFDIDPFLLALFDPAEYLFTYPACELRSADLNLDGHVDFFDIDPFLACLFGGPCP